MNVSLNSRGLGYTLAAAAMVLGGCAEESASQAMPMARAADDPAMALIVNEADPMSVQIGEHYQRARCVPDDRVVRVRFDPTVRVMDETTFQQVKKSVDMALDESIQFLALAWVSPNRVACMSISTAFSDGFDRTYCAKGCRMTRRSGYYDSDSRTPYTDHGIRPAFHVGAATLDESKALIDRGVAADGTRPDGAAYLVSTPDRRRNVRAEGFQTVLERIDGRLRAAVVRARGLKDKKDVLFYFTGVKRVPDLATNVFVAGAVGDSLTSASGILHQVKQTTVLDWLAAGVTGTYGTVVEPCNFREKFPDPAVLIDRYLDGETLMESYWKSVKAPGQGMFVGEPMSRPWGEPRNCPGDAPATAEHE